MFRSFYIAGFECATGVNLLRNRIDQVCATQHDRFLEQDYARLRQVGIQSAREGVRWPTVDGGGIYDFRTLDEVLTAANKYEIELLLDLFHYGYPADLDIFSESFAERFAGYCYAVAHHLSDRSEVPIHFTTVNEPSFFAWAGGHVGHFAPHAIDRAAELKYALVRAAIRGTNAMWSAIPDASIITIDPICAVVAGCAEDEEAARHFNDSIVFESLDMISGRHAPELGGSTRHLGTIGVNYYRNNQWVLNTKETLAMDDPRRVPLRELLMRVHNRYAAPVLISETSDSDDMRADWLLYVTDEVLALRELGVEAQGVCLYPILGMPEWHEPESWVRMGLWDLHPNSYGDLERHLHIPTFEALIESQFRAAWVTNARGMHGLKPVLH